MSHKQASDDKVRKKMRDEEENVMPVKTCAELEKLTFAGFWLRERAKSASASTAGEEAAVSQEMVVQWQKMRIKLVAGTKHTRF